MTQDEAKACAWAAWLAASKAALDGSSNQSEMAIEDTIRVLFDRWWRVHKRTLPGFARPCG